MIKKRRIVRRNKREKINTFVVISFIFIISIFLAGYFVGVSNKLEVQEQVEVEKELEFVGEDVRYSTLRVPAVDNEGNGVSTTLTVGVMPGTGRTLVDIDTLLFWVDTQNSIRTAKNVASNVTGVSLDNYDLVFDVDTNASLIGGPSAGAALTVATVSVIENRPLRDDVMITGAVNHDGTIGPVGGIIEKASAAKQAGYDLFLVPMLQSEGVVYETREHCEKVGFTQICTVEQIPIKIDVSKEAGIKVKEVSSIEESLDYFYVN